MHRSVGYLTSWNLQVWTHLSLMRWILFGLGVWLQLGGVACAGDQGEISRKVLRWWNVFLWLGPSEITWKMRYHNAILMKWNTQFHGKTVLKHAAIVDFSSLFVPYLRTSLWINWDFFFFFFVNDWANVFMRTLYHV